jgi:repressor LexA
VDSEELRRLRERLGLTQEQLARELGVHRVSVARWETGEHRIPEPVARLLGRLRQEAKAKKRRK